MKISIITTSKGPMVELYGAYPVRETLKKMGYSFNGCYRSWTKLVGSTAISVEISSIVTNCQLTQVVISDRQVA